MMQEIDNDKTLISPGAGKLMPPSDTRADAGHVANHEHLALTPGTRIAEFEITSVVGMGGFGIVYKTHDHSLGRSVALKEYMPSALARRVDGITVLANDGHQAETFAAGLRSFINEAHMLALFDHAALVKVYRFWEANGTAYMVMPYYEGQTLKKTLSDAPAPPSEAWLRQLLAPLLDALQIIHSKQCFHRDIAPDNIFLLADGRPVLLDFGAARQVIGDMGHNLTVILKPGYAPIEQYAGDPSMPQGPWTDIYALGAVLHCAITGAPPLTAVGRLIRDAYVPLQQTCVGRYSHGFLAAIDQALAVRLEQRPQSIAEFRCLLDGPVPADAPVALPAIRNKPAGRAGAWAAGAAALLASGAAWIFFMGQNEGTPPVPVAAVQPPAAPTPSASKPLPALAAADTPVAAPVFDAKALLDRVQQYRQTAHQIDVRIDKQQLIIGKDRFRFRIRSAQGGYVYVLMQGTNHELNLLFPNALDGNNQVKAGQELVLPSAKWSMLAAGPPGNNHLVAMVSDQPRDFAAAGLQRAGSFGEFPVATLRQQFLLNPGTANTLAGVAKCAGAASTCSVAYGAAQFTIEELTTASRF